jgi:hypothetical protein
VTLGKVILSLQAGGFASAIALLAIPGAPRWMFITAFAIHFAGDMLFLSKEGLPQMPFNIDNYVKLAPWLQFVGLMLAFGGLLALGHWFGKPLAFVGLGVSMAGFVYDKIYP